MFTSRPVDERMASGSTGFLCLHLRIPPYLHHCCGYPGIPDISVWKRRFQLTTRFHPLKAVGFSPVAVRFPLRVPRGNHFRSPFLPKAEAGMRGGRREWGFCDERVESPESLQGSCKEGNGHEQAALMDVDPLSDFRWRVFPLWRRRKRESPANRRRRR